MATITLPAGKYTVLAEGTVTFQNRESDVIVEGSLPSAFTSDQWSVSYDTAEEILTVTITDNLVETPEVNSVQVKVGDGFWINLTNTSDGIYKTYFPGVSTVRDVIIRKVNLIGAGNDSDTKQLSFTSTTISFTGLVSGEARIGSHASISYTISPDNGTETVAWGTSVGDDTYGTGSSPTDFTAGDEGSLFLTVTDGSNVVSASAPIRYAPGTAASISTQSFIVDDTNVSLNAAASGTGLTFSSYTLTGVPDLSIDSSTGAITGTIEYLSFLDTPSGIAQFSCLDKYGRPVTGTFQWSAGLRTQAVADSLNLSFGANSIITPVNLIEGWVTNGNTLTYSISPALPTGFIFNTSTAVLSGNSGDELAETAYTLSGFDEYGRVTVGSVSIEVTAQPNGTLSFTILSYNRGVAGVAPKLTAEILKDNTVTAPFTIWGALNSTALDKAGIDAHANKFSIGPQTNVDDLDNSALDITNSVTNGVLSAYVTDDSGSPIVSSVTTINNVTYDTVPPTFVSAEIGAVDSTSLIVTFSKAVYGSPSGSDFTVLVNGSPVTVSSVSLSGATADLTLASTVSSGQTVTVAYTGSSVVNIDAEAMATFTAQSVTNTTTSALPSFSDDFSGFSTNDNINTGPYSYVNGPEGAPESTILINASGRAYLSDATGSFEETLVAYDNITFSSAHRAETTIAVFGGDAAFEVQVGPMIAYTDQNNLVRAFGRSDGRVTLEVWVGGTRIVNANNASAGITANDVLGVEIDASGDITVDINGTPVSGLTAITPSSAVPVSSVKTGISWKYTSTWDTSSEISVFACEDL